MRKVNRTLGASMNASRRSFFKTATLAAGSLGVMGFRGANADALIAKQKISGDMDSKDMKLILAGYDFPRIKALIDGSVKIEGCSISYIKSGIGDTNTKTFSGSQPYDVAEIGLHPFMLAYANDNFRDYSLLPIFPLRLYRHKSVFIRNDRGISKPEDLKGKTIGTAGYSSTSLTWLRGIFKDEYNVSPQDVHWVTSNMDSSADITGKVSKQEQVAPDGVSIKPGPAGKDESELLLSGEVDALFHAAEPKAFIEGNPLVERLFPDPRKVERAYYSKTGIFPIMHAVAIRNEIVENNPWIAEAVFNAYSDAKKANYSFMRKLGWVYDSLPWYGQEYEETRKLMGENFWPYGIGPNRKTLETLFRYSYEQGLSSKNLTIDELFHPTSLGLKE